MEADTRSSRQSERIELFAEVVRPAIIELVLDFEKKSGHKVLTKFDLTPIVKKRIDQGVRFDVVIINPWMIDDLIEQKT
jgi:molybdate transport system substrate-binding protein